MEMNIRKWKNSKYAAALDLSGLWHFSLDQEGIGIEQHWERKNFSESIQLPGCLQAQGYGNPISTDTPWVLSLSDNLWYLRKEYQYAQQDMVRIPFLSQPPRHYTGKAWYQKKITVSKDRAGQWGRIFFECTGWITTLWLDGRKIGSVCSLCAPHSYELGILEEGEHTITVCVDNGWQLPYRPDSHTVSDGLGASWNGIGGSIFLELLPLVHIKKIRAFPDIHTKCVELEITVRNCLGYEMQIMLEARDASSVRDADSTRDAKDVNDAKDMDNIEQINRENTEIYSVKYANALVGESVHKLTLHYPKVQGLWDEFDHNLVKSLISVCPVKEQNSDIAEYEEGQNRNRQNDRIHEKEVLFGFREAYTKDGRFYINGRPSYLRGTHFGGDYPMTGIPDCSEAFWDRMMKTVKQWGMNFIRCHSYCPPEEAFAAADRAGVYLQIECGMWNIFAPDCEMNQVLWEETERILDTFGNHPSFLLLSPSNEPGGNWFEALSEWTVKCKKMDSRHLYTMQSGWAYPMPPSEIEGVDYVYFHRSGFGSLPNGNIRGMCGWKGGDYRKSLEGIKYPVICHELGQWCSYPDYRVIEKFNGYLYPGNFEIFRASAEEHGVLQQNAEFVYHSGRQQIRMLKEDLEANERTPHIYGYELLDLHDYLGQGTALVGILDAFWEEKGYIKPNEWREFCNETVILARIGEYVIDRASVINKQLEIPVEISHFGKTPLKGTILAWSLERIADDKESKDSCEKGEKGQRIDQTEKSEKREERKGSAKRENIVRAGYLRGGDFLQEKNQSAGCISLKLDGLEINKRYCLKICLKKGNCSENTSQTCAHICSEEGDVIAVNHWELWICDSKLSEEDVQHTVLETKNWKEAKKGLDMGKKVLFSIPFYDISYDCPPVRFRSVFWNSQMGPTWGRGMGIIVQNRHPAFAGFDTASDGGWQWERLIDGARGLRTEHLHQAANLVCPIDEWNRNYKMSVLLECRVGEGRLMLTTIDFDREQAECPEAAALKQSILSYMESDGFNPEGCCHWEQIEQLLEPNQVMSQYQIEGYAESRMHSSVSEFKLPCSDGTFIENCLDGNPETYCRLTGGFPYYIVTKAPKKHQVKGILYMPRQDHREHEGELREYRVEVWTEEGWLVAAEGELQSSFEPKRIFFKNSVLTDSIRLTAVSGFEKVGKQVWKRHKDGWYQDNFKEEDSCFSVSVLKWILEEDIISPQGKRKTEIIERSATAEIDL